ncbi:MAG: amino acid adenylation domain-containing protein, partial [Rhodococcus sp. (in: high G+C Gram-positive bacteria)]
GRGEAVLDDVIGMFVNTLVLRTSVVGSARFVDVLSGVREVDLSAFAHADVPFERVVEVIDPPRTQGVHPLVQVLLTFQNFAATSFDLPGLTASSVDFDSAVAKMDLQVTVTEPHEQPDGTRARTVEIVYATDLFDAETVARLGGGLVAVLGAVTSDSFVVVGDIDVSGPGERALVAGVNDTGFEVDGSATLVSLFAAQVAVSPDAVAVTFEGVSLTYAEFDSRSNVVARALIARGVGVESLVGLAVRRSLDLMVGLYGVVKAGAGYVPVDVDQPADRVQYILETSGVGLVLTTSRDGFVSDVVSVLCVDEISGGSFSDGAVSDGDRIGVLRPGNVAYVLFTSGSTGRPKGVSVSHGAIVNRLVWMQERYGLDARDVVVQKTPVTFDVSVWELFWPLQVGARLVVARPDGHRDPVYLAELMGVEGVSVAHFVPSMLAVFAAEEAAVGVGSLRWVFASGEALPVSTARAIQVALPGVRLVNLYGPTEAAVDVTFHEFDGAVDVSSVPIGRPVFNTRVWVLDSRLRVVPVGMVGELYLAGVQLARGYHGRAELTADRFVADPFDSAGGGRLYRTGDVVRWSSGGELEYVGRSDFQVKLRGLRIELGEIESALLAEGGVAQAVVLVRHDQLVAYVVPSAGSSVDVGVLELSVAGVLPGYMVPSAFVVLDGFPLSAAGKLDRRALPDPVFVVREFREPVSEVECVVAGVFADVLGVSGVGLDDDFFALGGNSLIATQVVSRIGAALDASVPVRALFDATTVETFANAVAALAGTGGRPALVAETRPDRIPLSLAQQRMWFLDKFEPNSAAYNIPIVVRLQGDLDFETLSKAIDDVRERHESLRTIYPEIDGVGHQVVVPLQANSFELGFDECTEIEALERIKTLVTRGFTLAQSAPFRAHLYRLDDAENLLAVVVHHIAADGFSMGPLVRDIVTAYSARSSGTPPQWRPLAVQYADYAVWQRDMLGDETDPESDMSKQIAYWTSRLAGVPEQLDLPTDRPRPTHATERGAVHSFAVSSRLHRSIVELGLELGCTPFMVVHAAFAVLLARLSNTEDVTIGTPIAGRGERALDDVIGMFVNTLVLRTEITGSRSVRDLLAAVREIDLDAFAHSDVPFERLVEVLDPPRSTARQPLFQVMLAFQNLERSKVELPGIGAAGVELETGLSKFDLYLTVSEKFDSAGEPLGMLAQFLYLTDLFDEATIVTAGERLREILETMVADQSALIGDIDILTTDEAMAVNERWVGTAAPESNELLLDRYLAAVRQQPESVAVTFEEKSLTYSQFDSRVNELTRYLLARGIGPECVVAVAIHRSVEMLVSIYAVVRAGAAYLPVDPDQPHERIRYALSSADVSLILSTSSDLLGVDGFEIVEVDTLPPGRYSNATIDENELAAGGPDSAAYVLFTSGSTGRPKGVVISHRAIVNRLNWMQSEYSLRGEDVVVQKTPITFDVSVWELFWPLQYGARMVVARPGGHRDPAYLAHLLREHSVTVAHFVPSMLAVFAEEQAVGHIDSIRWLFASGEALPTTTARAAVQALPSTRLVNLYGPTEAAVDVTFHEVTEDDTVVVPIGRPVSGTRVHVLDGRLKPAVPGVIGELYLGGVQLARGYASRADLSAERFVANPFGSGERLYRTGDLVRWNRAGEIEYVGRSDFQVKLRGQRIELGDIEAALLTNPGVSRAVVALVDDPAVGETIVGYIVCRAGLTLDPDEVRGTAAGALPDYMVPTSIMIMDAFPLGPNGKLDRRAFPEPTVRIRPFRPPSTPVEEMIAETFGALLGVERIGLDDDFFSLGGNSLIATRVVARLGVAFGVEISLRTLFEAPSVHALAVRIEHETATGLDAGGSLESSLFGRQPMQARRDRDTPAPLSLAQQRMWFLNRLDPDSAANNVPVIISLEGELDVDALVVAFRDVLARHDILRTVYPDIDGVGYQVVEPLAAGAVSSDPVVLEIEQIDPGEARPRALEMLGGGFDVTAGVPVRAALLCESPQYHVLVVVAHHISVDGFSIGPLTRDLAQAYAARASGQAPGWSRPALQYADFAVWQREILGAEDDPSSIASAQLDYWTRQLVDLPDEIELPTDRPRPAEMSYRGAATSVAVDAVLRRRITALANASGVTPFMVMHGALAVLLARMSDTDDVAIGTPVAGRGSAELDDMIGMFVNTLVLRTQVDSALTFADLLAEVRESDLSAFAHSDVPFERIVDVVDPQRSRGRHPLFQVMYTFQNLEGTRLELGDLTVGGIELDTVHAKFDLQITVSDSHDSAASVSGWNVEFVYATDLFDRSTVDAMGARLLRLLTGLLDAPDRPVGDIELVDPFERARLLQTWSASSPDHPMAIGTLVDRFDAVVAASP